MNANQQGVELGNLAKLLFDKAVTLWYSAIYIEVVVGLSAVIINLNSLSDSWNIFCSFLGFIFLLLSYCLKIWFSLVYDRAETMRRQSVLTMALGWPITKFQFTEWRRLAGKKILTTLELKKSDPDYFATKEDLGAKRLLEMTQESAFWTRHLYCYLRSYVWIAFAVAVVFFIVLLTGATTDFIPHGFAQKLVYVIYLLLPLLLTIDLLGLGIKLNQLIFSIKEVENDLEHLSLENDLSDPKVLRLVSEYNCQVVSGIPIPNWFFGKHHDLIDSLWKKR